MPTTETPARNFAWLTTLDVAAVLGSMMLACMTPFVALAVAAALTLPRRVGVTTVLVAWGANQAIGYGMLGYPTDGMTILRGVAIGICALTAFAIGCFGRSADGSLVATRAVAAFALAFIAYELVMYLSAVVLGGTENFTAGIVWMIGSNDAMWFAGLMALHLALTAGLPALFGRRPALRLA